MKSYLDGVGSTPMVEIKLKELGYLNLYAKLEFYNPTGSVKDRAAAYIIDKLLETKEINSDTTILESSSGNFGIALSAYCKKKGQKFCCVTDPNITYVNQILLHNMCSNVIMVSEQDGNGGYLINRIKKINELLITIPNSYWINQYNNPYNAEAYNALGEEICEQLGSVDYVFIGVSSGGTITGVSQKVKQKYPNSKIIAVDIEGSVIFGGKPQKRHIPGMGSSIVPGILNYARIDDVIIVDELETVKRCNQLLKDHSIFAGGSSGSVIAAVNKYFSSKRSYNKPNVVMIFPDKGDRYTNTIYNAQWVKEVLEYHNEYTNIT